MPPSGFTPKAVEGALTFIGTCYEDLLAEVRSGKYKSIEEGIEHELGLIKKALTKLHLDNDGNITER
ncbi:MAG: hypothetical protein A2365_01695 [Candidatus Nealsonbacteria bacterium RIFOXYB1_FULL_40_15]|uniref:Uncharacterized protein n=2 Tax=Candidatus Nealsoniibacteriota TaxID=1817911 RepID=A0A1G2END7_9BACT|nr:MAG: hypothetical protein A2427_00525 [Candidatus Nealsonbacteria bacterium RIFOXYC1_FULL_40_7]OGZ27559.1 MAG: hypothetical protein A2365_01695 [Candidatus Nealsonbacteria bacterium RIFOXYB1_FULL_40_15]OGZ28282.1 MAG: hypothetical protein A2562_04395 [Candidatus Nealsonbacteria bacterium RIFOXYD1_FULL_39_11]